MDIRLERFLREQKQLTNTYAKILEINPEHAVIRSLAQKVEGGATEQDATVRDIALLLLDQAKILEGMNSRLVYSSLPSALLCSVIQGRSGEWAI